MKCLDERGEKILSVGRVGHLVVGERAIPEAGSPRGAWWSGPRIMPAFAATALHSGVIVHGIETLKVLTVFLGGICSRD